MITTSMSDLRHNRENAVIIDSLTVLSGLRALSGYAYHPSSRHCQARLFPGVYEEKRTWKIDYETKDAFRLAVDLNSLAQFVEAVVLFDKILIDTAAPKAADPTLFPSVQMLKRLPTSLEDVLCGLQVPARERIVLLLHAARKAESYSKSEAFVDFLRLMFVSSTDGAYVHISNGYFGTGYSDIALFPRTVFEMIEEQLALESVAEMTRAGSKPPAYSEYLEQIKDITKDMKSSLYASGYETINAATSLAHAVVPEKLGRDWELEWASFHMLKNVLAALFYDGLAQYCNLPYFPHILRSSFVGFDRVMANRSSLHTRGILDVLEESRRLQANSLNDLFRQDVIDLEVPFVLGLILEESRKPEDILPLAVEIRNSREAKDFREWSRVLIMRVRSGEMTLPELKEDVQEIQRHLSKWATHSVGSSSRKTVEVGLSVGPLSVTIPLGLDRPKRRRVPNHIVFLQRMAQLSDRTPRFASLLAKVFGSEIARFWDRFRSIVGLYQNPKRTWFDFEVPTHNFLTGSRVAKLLTKITSLEGDDILEALGKAQEFLNSDIEGTSTAWQKDAVSRMEDFLREKDEK